MSTVGYLTKEREKLLPKIGTIGGVLLIGIGTLLLIWDLGRPARFYYLFRFINPTSMISIGSLILLAFMVLSIVHIGTWIWPFKWLEKKRGTNIAISVINSVLAFAIAVYTGVLLGVVSNIPLWNTPILPLLFLVSALSTGIMGVALSLPIGRKFIKEEESVVREAVHRIEKTDMILIIVELLVIFFYVIVLYTSTVVTARNTVHLLVAGNLAPLFWGMVIVIGLLAPLILGGISLRLKEATPWIIPISSAVLILIGGLILRYVILAAGIQIPIL